MSCQNKQAFFCQIIQVFNECFFVNIFDTIFTNNIRGGVGAQGDPLLPRISDQRLFRGIFLSDLLFVQVLKFAIYKFF